MNGATRITAGKYGRALSFDGLNDLVTAPDSASLDFTAGVTMEAWVFPTSVAGYKTVVMKEAPACTPGRCTARTAPASRTAGW